MPSPSIYLAEYRLDGSALAAALLHDVAEDTLVSVDQISEQLRSICFWRTEMVSDKSVINQRSRTLAHPLQIVGERPKLRISPSVGKIGAEWQNWANAALADNGRGGIGDDDQFEDAAFAGLVFGLVWEL